MEVVENKGADLQSNFKSFLMRDFKFFVSHPRQFRIVSKRKGLQNLTGSNLLKRKGHKGQSGRRRMEKRKWKTDKEDWANRWEIGKGECAYGSGERAVEDHD